MSSSDQFRPYHYGLYKWDNYLLDIHQTIKGDVDLQQDVLRQQEDQTADLRLIQETLASGLEELRAEFQWGFTLIVDRMDRQIQLLSKIVGQLDAIHKTLQSPLMTQARELFHIGQERHSKGLWDKALEAFLQAEQKNEVDFPLQLQMGKLYLYGRNEDNNVIDLPLAEKHMRLAARYAQAERETVQEWKTYCGQALFHAAVAAYLIGEQNQKSGSLDGMRQSLERALAYLAEAVIVWPAFTESVYLQAKCYALLGQRHEALERLDNLSDKDRRYYAKSASDKDFDVMRDEIRDLFSRAATSPGPFARATEALLVEAIEALGWAKRSKQISTADRDELASTEKSLIGGRQSLRGLDVDIKNIHSLLVTSRHYLMVEDALRNRIRSIESEIKTTESRKASCEASIHHLKEEMKLPEGKEIGCLFSLIFGFVSFYVVAYVVISVLGMKDKDTYLPLVTLSTFAMAVVGFVLGRAISRSRTNRPHKQQVAKHARTIDGCDRLLPTLRQQLNESKQELDEFLAWRAQRPTPPQ